jgi:hypothetical protein
LFAFRGSKRQRPFDKLKVTGALSARRVATAERLTGRFALRTTGGALGDRAVPGTAWHGDGAPWLQDRRRNTR